MTDLAVIILTKDEKLHIGRCLERLAPLNPKQIFVVDCLSTDGTQEIVEKFRVEGLEFRSDGSNSKLETSNSKLRLVGHEWPGNQAIQFNWALDNLPINAKWVLRIDADEYLSAGLISEIQSFVGSNGDEDVALVELPLARTWQRHRVRFGMPRKYISRLFRFGLCRYGEREMDEKLIPKEGRTIRFRHEFIDDNLNDFEWWKCKHRNYAEREARQAIGGAHGNKSLYYRFPPYLRAIAYWAVRYFLFCGFLDGRTGWSWNFWQGLWYRWLVDRKIGRMKHVGRHF